jgi:hypothetical protein
VQAACGAHDEALRDRLAALLVEARRVVARDPTYSSRASRGNMFG